MLSSHQADCRVTSCCSDVTKRPIFMFVSICDSARAISFRFSASPTTTASASCSPHAHWQWFVTKCSKLKSDFRYSAESVFDTFPWPQAPSEKQIDAVAAAGREIRRIRSDALANLTGGLRALYRTLELPGKNPLKDAHAALDAAVLAAYGFSAKADLLAQLLALNREVARRLSDHQPVTAPGIPATHSRPETLLSGDCLAVDNK